MMTNTTPRPLWAAVQKAWFVSLPPPPPPSPPPGGRGEGELHAERRGEPPADAAAPEAEEALGVLAAEELPEPAPRGDRFLHDHGVGRQALGDGVDQGQRRDRLAAARGQRPLLQLGDRPGAALVRVFQAGGRPGGAASPQTLSHP